MNIYCWHMYAILPLITYLGMLLLPRRHPKSEIKLSAWHTTANSHSTAYCNLKLNIEILKWLQYGLGAQPFWNDEPLPYWRQWNEPVCHCASYIYEYGNQSMHNRFDILFLYVGFIILKPIRSDTQKTMGQKRLGNSRKFYPMKLLAITKLPSIWMYHIKLIGNS